jgi:hypothetical protein
MNPETSPNNSGDLKNTSSPDIGLKTAKRYTFS